MIFQRCERSIYCIGTPNEIPKLRYIVSKIYCIPCRGLSLWSLLILFFLPSDNVQYDLQHRSLITFPKEENLGNKRKPLHQVYLPFVPTLLLIDSIRIDAWDIDIEHIDLIFCLSVSFRSVFLFIGIVAVWFLSIGIVSIWFFVDRYW